MTKDHNNYLENTFNTRFMDLSSSQTEKFKTLQLRSPIFPPNQLDCDPRKDFMNMYSRSHFLREKQLPFSKQQRSEAGEEEEEIIQPTR